MNKKGFTLVQMVAVLAILSAIILIAIPSITSLVKKSEEDKYNTFLNNVYLATEAYLQKYIDDYPELKNTGGEAYIYMVDLVNEKFISSNLVNPKYCVNDECTAKRITTCDTNNDCTVDNYKITVTKEDDGTYSYELSLE